MTLQLRRRRSNQAVEPQDGHFILQGEADWLLGGPPAAVAEAVGALGGVAERIADGLALLSFGNAVGFFEVPGLGTVEVVAGKWRHDDFERMLAELMAIAVGLPFAADEPSALPYARDVEAPADVLYHAFVYLRYALSNRPPDDERLLPALRLVLHEPHQRLQPAAAVTPLERAGSLGPAALVGIASGAGGWERAGLAGHLRLAQALRGHLPQHVEERRVLAILDTPENRFVKAFLDQALGIVAALRRAVADRGQDIFAERLLRDCRTLEADLSPLRRHRLWDQVGPLVSLPAGSPVLQRRRGYREVYRHYARLRLATRLPLDAERTRDLLEAKDIALLYELWCFFTVERELARLLGPPAQAGRPVPGPFSVVVPWKLRIAWENGIQLHYNPSFSRSRAPEQRAYSTPLRPDIGLLVPSGPNAGWHLLDAKFRVDRVGDLLPLAGDGEEERAEERRGTIKRADLYKMHTYRDAISRARTAWVLFPGDQARFFARDGTAAASPFSALPTVLDGVGAVPLLPGSAHPELAGVLRRLLIWTGEPAGAFSS